MRSINMKNCQLQPNFHSNFGRFSMASIQCFNLNQTNSTAIFLPSQFKCLLKPKLHAKFGLGVRSFNDVCFSYENTRQVLSFTKNSANFSPTPVHLINRKEKLTFQLYALKKTFSSFEDLLDSSDVVLVDFYATWCGPCKLMADILESASSKIKETIKDVKIVKIDTDKYPNIASKYFVQALPTLILFKNGIPIDRFEGALPPDELVSRIQESVNMPS